MLFIKEKAFHPAKSKDELVSIKQEEPRPRGVDGQTSWLCSLMGPYACSCCEDDLPAGRRGQDEQFDR
jgi:hypothetical protein